MIDSAAGSLKARAKLSRKSCVAWHKYNAGAMSYDEVQEIIQSAEAMCQREIEAAYKATDPQNGINVNAGVSA